MSRTASPLRSPEPSEFRGVSFGVRDANEPFASVRTSSAGRFLLAPIDPGFDLFETTSGTFVDLPVIGIVPLEGDPGPLAPLGNLGNTDTIVERLQGSGAPFDPPTDLVVIDIELVALSLRSVSPVDISGTLFDLELISGSLLGEPGNPTGSMTIRHENSAGGSFSATLPVDVRLIFTEVGNPLNTFEDNIQKVFTSSAPWSHNPPSGYPQDPTFPAGGFFPTGIILEDAPSPPPAQHVVRPANDGSQVIGGTYIPIDQSALLLAGVQSVSMWMIPILAGIGIGVFVIKRKK